ncbi:MAG TPA: CocE/NonD family hydrolase [Streptosporangiaceae bacterium]|nr:CocE/NonD family hydrolase [Streptosporangiaceae bacterium]
MALEVKETPKAEAAGKLPVHVRFFTRQSRKGLPPPVCEVALKRGIRIPMPDGTHQIADRYIPQTDGPCPTLLVRTPYGRGFPYDFMYGGLFAEHGYNVLLQSTRGTGGSGGDPEPFTSEAADGLATIAWLREQPWFTGSFATIGASYLGFTQWALASDPPPELKAMVVQVSADDFYEFLYPGGAFALEATLTGVAAMVSQEKGFRAFMAAVLRLILTYRKVERMLPLVPGYKLAFGQRVGFLEDWLAHPAAVDRYWEPRRANPDISAMPPVHLLGGWHDVVIDPTLDSYRRLREAGRTVRLVVGPWNHTSGFNKDMPIIAPEALAWLRAHLNGNDDAQGQATVRVHVGEIGGSGCWRDLTDWPPPEAATQAWHPRAGGTLAASPGEGSSSFRYDPRDPTPSVGGPRMDSNGHGPKDNRKLEARGDVLVFTGPVISEPLEVIGQVSIRLLVRGSSPYFDIFARLCEVDAKGRSWNICDGLLRLDGTRPADADGWTEIEVPMSATARIFAPGHRVRLQISGGAHPRFARNTGTAEQIATGASLVPVEIEISHGETVLSLPVLPRVL